MDNQELLQTLREGKLIAGKIEKLMSRRKKIAEPIIHTAFLLSVVISGCVVFLSPDEMVPVGGVTKLLCVLFMALPVFGTVMFMRGILAIFPMLLELMSKLYGRLFNRRKIKECDKEFYHLRDLFRKTNIPDAYLSSTILTKFEVYVHDGLADSIKECALLFREDVRDEKLLQKIEAIRSEIVGFREDFQLFAFYRSTGK